MVQCFVILKKYTHTREKASRRRIFFGDFLRLAGYHKTAKPALEILAIWRFSGPTERQKGGCRTTRLADFVGGDDVPTDFDLDDGSDFDFADAHGWPPTGCLVSVFERTLNISMRSELNPVELSIKPE